MFNPTSSCKPRAGHRPADLPRGVALAVTLLVLLAPLAATPTTLSSDPLPTYTSSTTSDIKPNILMVLDDSGSMDWDYLPDWANDNPGNYTSLPPYLTRNASFNGVAYNPAVRYQPPVRFTTTGTKDTTSYPSMDGSSAARGADISQAMPNWRAVKRDGYGIQSTSTSNITSDAYFYTTVPGEYCSSPALTSCTTTSAATSSNQYAAPLRWCDSTALTNCRGLQDSTFKYPRMPAPRIATIRFTNTSSKTVAGVTVGTNQIMSAASSSGGASTLASSVVSQINACTLAKPTGSNCTVVGYFAEVTGSSSDIVRIYAPVQTTDTPVVTGSSAPSYTATAFDIQKIPLPAWLNGSQSTNAIPGENLRTVITPSLNSYVLPGTAAKAPGRTDCASTTCTYVEEMTNYANWFAYYRTRMQMMKTATSRAFAVLDTDADIALGRTRYRVGYLSINNNTGTDFVNITDFDPAQKVTWYSKLFAANPNNSTPLRQALSTAGRLYGGVLNGQTLNGTRVVEPLQFSCQKNYTILSTDGFWNGNAGTKLDGSTSLGNQDGALPRPYNDGATAVVQQRTSKLQQSTGQLQKRTSSTSGKKWTSWANATTCTPDSSGSDRTECQTDWSTYTDVSSCTVTTTFDGNGRKTACQYTTWSNWSNIASCTPMPKSSAPNYTVGSARECQAAVTGGTTNTLADVAAYYYNTDLRDSAATGADSTGTCTGPVVPPSTSPSDLCANNVPAAGRDNNPRQHMTTHTLGLGAQGRMVFSPYQNDLAGNRVYTPDYWQQPTGDFYSVANGVSAAPASGICGWLSSGTSCTWPTPASDSPANIDDLWHAAVNGHGTYFSATDPNSLSDALRTVLNTIVNTPRPGTAAAAASSNPNITSSDNYVFSSSYRSVDWTGELIMQRINPDATLTRQRWSAMRLLDCATTAWQPNRQWQTEQSFSYGGKCYVVDADYTSLSTWDEGGLETQNALPLSGLPVTRTVYTAGLSGTTPTLVPFTWGNLTATQQSYFSLPYINYVSATQGLTQFCTIGAACLSATAQTAAAGSALVDYLRGVRTNEGSYFRRRAHVLGDIVSSEARYVKVPLGNYGDPGFAEFKNAMGTREPTVYVGANDGMLHAFNALSGQERWAFVPTAVLPELHRLADTEYATKHRYFVDGTTEVGDICPSAPSINCDATTWRTILVGGLNQGGKAFFALDITNPASPRLLWEISTATTGFENLGFSYSNPRIGKLADGRWVVAFASGYNNADGIGRLYIVNAATGALINTISTGVGSAANASGLTKLAAYANSGNIDNTMEQIYGGDLLGNLWRFDVNDTIGMPGTDAQRMVTFQDRNGVAQPITAKPALGEVQNLPLVIVGTGQYLGVPDLGTTTQQTMYAVKDKRDAVSLTSPRLANSKFVAQTVVETTCPADAPTTVCDPGQTVRTVTANAVDWSSDNGWYTDFALGGERSVTDATLALGTVVFTTVKPQSSSGGIIGCTSAQEGTSATSYLYYLDYLTGGAVAGTKNVVAEELCTCIATRPSVIRTQSGTLEGIIRTSGGGATNTGNDTGSGSGTGGTGGTGGDTGGNTDSNTSSTCNTGVANVSCTEGDNKNSDGGGTSEQRIPYEAGGGAARRTSWRELNGQ